MDPDSPRNFSKLSPRLQQLAQWFRSNALLPDLVAGLVIGFLGLLLDVSLGTLVFSGELSQFSAVGMSIALISSVVVRLATLFSHAYPATIVAVDDIAAVVLAVIVASVVENMSSGATEGAILSTVLVAIALTSLLSGAFYWLLGQFKLGDLVRFVPYPVFGGFLAGNGWLFVKGGLGVMTDASLEWSQLSAFVQPDLLLRWVPGLLFGLALLFVSRYQQFWVIPLTCLSAIGLFYAALGITGTSIQAAQQQGWILAATTQSGSWQPFNFSLLTQVDWSALWPQSGGIITLMILCSINALLVVSSLELLVQRDIDPNQALKSVGLGNLLSGLAGGMMGGIVLGDTTLVHTMGGKSRLVGIAAFLPYLLVLLVGASSLVFLPKAFVGGLLLFLGLYLLREWVWNAGAKLPKADYAVTLLILLVIATTGFLQGVGVGLVAAVVLFVINYSRISLTRYALSGETYQSHTARPLSQSRLLRQEGSQTYILDLQGFIFFGTANKLLNQVRQRMTNTYLLPLKFVVLNFQAVTGLDSSAVLSFVKLKQVAQQQRFQLVLTQLSGTLQKQLTQGGCLQQDDPVCHISPNLDSGVEWCEEEILKAARWRRQRSLPLALQLEDLLDNSDHASMLMQYLERVEADAGQELFRQGDVPLALYFIESGQVAVSLVLEQGRHHRVQTLGSGYPVGEMNFFSQLRHQTSALVHKSSVLYRLSWQNWQQLQQTHPEAAATVQGVMLRLMGDRLIGVYREVADFLR